MLKILKKLTQKMKFPGRHHDIEKKWHLANQALEAEVFANGGILKAFGH